MRSTKSFKRTFGIFLAGAVVAVLALAASGQSAQSFQGNDLNALPGCANQCHVNGGFEINRATGVRSPLGGVMPVAPAPSNTVCSTRNKCGPAFCQMVKTCCDANTGTCDNTNVGPPTSATNDPAPTSPPPAAMLPPAALPSPPPTAMLPPAAIPPPPNPTQAFQQPRWCSAQARFNSVERFICATNDLWDLDLQLNDRYHDALRAGLTSRNDQLDWVQVTRNGCGPNLGCLAGAYTRRIAELPTSAINNPAPSPSLAVPAAACPRNFYRCSLNAGGKLDPAHPDCCWNLRND